MNDLTRSGGLENRVNMCTDPADQKTDIHPRDRVLSQLRGYLQSPRSNIDFSDYYYSNIQILINTNR
jgi:hypothetical protein